MIDWLIDSLIDWLTEAERDEVCQLTRLVSEEHFASLLERHWILLAVEQMMQHSVEDLFSVRFWQV